MALSDGAQLARTIILEMEEENVNTSKGLYELNRTDGSDWS